MNHSHSLTCSIHSISDGEMALLVVSHFWEMLPALICWVKVCVLSDLSSCSLFNEEVDLTSFLT